MVIWNTLRNMYYLHIFKKYMCALVLGWLAGWNLRLMAAVRKPNGNRVCKVILLTVLKFRSRVCIVSTRDKLTGCKVAAGKILLLFRTSNKTQKRILPWKYIYNISSVVLIACIVFAFLVEFNSLHYHKKRKQWQLLETNSNWRLRLFASFNEIRRDGFFQ